MSKFKPGDRVELLKAASTYCRALGFPEEPWAQGGQPGQPSAGEQGTVLRVVPHPSLDFNLLVLELDRSIKAYTAVRPETCNLISSRIRCGCNAHDLDPDRDPYVQHREYLRSLQKEQE